MIYTEADFKTNWMLNQVVEGDRDLTKIEMLVLKELVWKNQGGILTKQKVPENGRYLQFKRNRAELILVKDGKSYVLKIFRFGNVQLKNSGEIFFKLSSKSEFNRNFPAGAAYLAQTTR